MLSPSKHSKPFFFRLHEVGVVPEIFRLVSLKGIEKSLGVVGKDMAAVPALRFFDFRENHQRLDGSKIPAFKRLKGVKLPLINTS